VNILHAPMMLDALSVTQTTAQMLRRRPRTNYYKKTTKQVHTWNATFPLAVMWPLLKAAQNNLNESKTRVKSLKVCTRVNVVDA